VVQNSKRLAQNYGVTDGCTIDELVKAAKNEGIPIYSLD